MRAPSFPARRMAVIVAAVALSQMAAPPVAASPGGVKAVMIYNIVRFMALPEAKPKVRLCLRRGEDIAPDLAALAGEPVGAGQLEVAQFGALADMRGCDALYLGASPAAAVMPGHGQVTIGEGARFAEEGGTVGLVNFGGQVRFAINARSAARSGVKVSSQLLRLAARIVN